MTCEICTCRHHAPTRAWKDGSRQSMTPTGRWNYVCTECRRPVHQKTRETCTACGWVHEPTHGEQPCISCDGKVVPS